MERQKVTRFFLPCQQRSVKPPPSTFNLYEITHRTHPKSLSRSRLPARASRLLILITGQAAGPGLLDLLHRVHHLDHRRLVENLLKSRTARLGRHHPDLQLDRLVQDRWPASMVGSVAANLLSDLLYHPLA